MLTAHPGVFASRSVQTEVVIAVKSDIAGMPDVPDAPIRFGEFSADVLGVVLRRVVADDNLEIGVILSANTSDALAQTAGAIARRHADRNQGRRQTS